MISQLREILLNLVSQISLDKHLDLDGINIVALLQDDGDLSTAARSPTGRPRELSLSNIEQAYVTPSQYPVVFLWWKYFVKPDAWRPASFGRSHPGSLLQVPRQWSSRAGMAGCPAQLRRICHRNNMIDQNSTISVKISTPGQKHEPGNGPTGPVIQAKRPQKPDVRDLVVSGPALQR